MQTLPFISQGKVGPLWSCVEPFPLGPASFQWISQAGFELVQSFDRSGHFFAADAVEPVSHGDLILIGPKLPYAWQMKRGTDQTRPAAVRSVRFSQYWVDHLLLLIPELAGLLNIMRRARGALKFSASVAAQVKSLLERMPSEPNETRILTFISILTVISADRHACQLSTAGAADIDGDDKRIFSALDYLHEHYIRRRILLRELAEAVEMSEGAFQKLFTRHMGTTPPAYIARLRIGHAAALLIEGGHRMTDIASLVGYEGQGTFNKEFKRQKGMTPSEFFAWFEAVRRGSSVLKRQPVARMA